MRNCTTTTPRGFISALNGGNHFEIDCVSGLLDVVAHKSLHRVQLPMEAAADKPSKTSEPLVMSGKEVIIDTRSSAEHFHFKGSSPRQGREENMMMPFPNF